MRCLNCFKSSRFTNKTSSTFENMRHSFSGAAILSFRSKQDSSSGRLYS